MRTSTIILLMTVALAAGATAGGGGVDEGHPSLLPAVGPNTDFPLYEAGDLARHGYPDHQHLYFWPGWNPPLDADGEAYGFGSFCAGLHARDRAGFETAPGKIRFAPFAMDFNAEAEPCLVAPFLGFCEMALLDATELFGLEAVGDLHLINPDDSSTYGARTGYGTWRMFSYADGVAVVQPVGILARRTLIAHAARDLVLQWLLDVNGADDLPAWLREGLSAWFAEMGVHLSNYMASFRLEGPVLATPERIEAILTSPAAADGDVDRRDYRIARYGAFLMVWNLVEDHGGLDPLRRVIADVGEGASPDAAFLDAYGMGLADITTLLDPTTTGEPIGDQVQPRNPARPPRAGG